MKKAVISLNLLLLCPLYAMETKPQQKNYALYCQIDPQLYDLEQALEPNLATLPDSIAKKAIENNQLAWKRIENLFEAKEKQLNTQAKFSQTFGGMVHTFNVITKLKKAGTLRFIKLQVIDTIDETNFCMGSLESVAPVVVSKEELEKELLSISHITTVLSTDDFKEKRANDLDIKNLTALYQNLVINKHE